MKITNQKKKRRRSCRDGRNARNAPLGKIDREIFRWNERERRTLSLPLPLPLAPRAKVERARNEACISKIRPAMKNAKTRTEAAGGGRREEENKKKHECVYRRRGGGGIGGG